MSKQLGVYFQPYYRFIFIVNTHISKYFAI
jgi:hypothetical protein